MTVTQNRPSRLDPRLVELIKEFQSRAQSGDVEAITHLVSGGILCCKVLQELAGGINSERIREIAGTKEIWPAIVGRDPEAQRGLATYLESIQLSKKHPRPKYFEPRKGKRARDFGTAANGLARKMIEVFRSRLRSQDKDPDTVEIQKLGPINEQNFERVFALLYRQVIELRSPAGDVLRDPALVRLGQAARLGYLKNWKKRADAKTDRDGTGDLAGDVYAAHRRKVRRKAAELAAGNKAKASIRSQIRTACEMFWLGR